MARYRNHLPQLSSDLFLTDGGLETTLIFHQGINLPDFAAFDLIKDNIGYQILQSYYRTYASLARAYVHSHIKCRVSQNVFARHK